MKNSASSRITWALFRNIGFPVVALFCCMIFGVSELNIILAVVIITATPTATNSYILARQMGGDAPFMASLIGTSTLFSVITFPIIIYIIFKFWNFGCPLLMFLNIRLIINFKKVI